MTKNISSVNVVWEERNRRITDRRTFFFVLDLHMGWIEGRRERERREVRERGWECKYLIKRGREGGVPSTIAR